MFEIGGCEEVWSSYGAVELPPLTQTKNTTQKPKTRIVLCRQLGGVLCSAVATTQHSPQLTTQHKTPNVTRVCGWALCCVVARTIQHNAQPQTHETLSVVSSIGGSVV